MARKLATVFVNNLKTTARYVGHLIVECYADAGLTTMVGSASSNVQWDGTYNKQKDLIQFDGLEYGTTYYLRAGVLAPVSGTITWSATWSEIAGTPNAPQCSYAYSANITTAGVTFTVTPANVPANINHYDVFWNNSGTAPSSTDKVMDTKAGSSFDIFVPGKPGQTCYLWVRGVNTAHDVQAWEAVGNQPVANDWAGTINGTSASTVVQGADRANSGLDSTGTVQRAVPYAYHDANVRNVAKSDGTINNGAVISGRTETVGTTVQHLDGAGVVLSTGIDFSRGYQNQTQDFIGDGVDYGRTTHFADALVYNGDFEQSATLPPAGWDGTNALGVFAAAPTSLSWETTMPYAGVRSISITGGRNTGIANLKKTPIKPGEQYKVVGAIKGNATNMDSANIYFWMGHGAATNDSIINIAATLDGSWHLKSAVGTVPAGSTWGTLLCDVWPTAGTGDGTAEFDSIQLIRISSLEDEVSDGPSYFRTNQDQRDGGGRGWNALNSVNDLVTGTTNRTVNTLEQVVGSDGRAKHLDLTSINAGSLDNVPDGPSFGKSTFNQITGAGRGYNALDALNNLATGTDSYTVAQLNDGNNRSLTGLALGGAVQVTVPYQYHDAALRNRNGMAIQCAGQMPYVAGGILNIPSTIIAFFPYQAQWIRVMGGTTLAVQSWDTIYVPFVNGQQTTTIYRINFNDANYQSTLENANNIILGSINDDAGGGVLKFMAPWMNADHFARVQSVINTSAQITNGTTLDNSSLTIGDVHTRVGSAISTLFDLTTGTPNKTVSQIESGVGAANAGLNSSGQLLTGTAAQSVANINSGVSSANAGLDSLGHITVGTPNRTVSQIEGVVGSNGQANNLNLGSIGAGNYDNIPDGSSYKKLAAVNTSNQATTASIKAGAVNAQITQQTTSYQYVTTSGQIASVTITPNGGYVKVRLYLQIAPSGGTDPLGYDISIFRGDSTGTKLAQFGYGSFPYSSPGTSQDGIYVSVALEGIDTSPGTLSTMYTAYASTNTGCKVSIIPTIMVVENAQA